MSYPALKNGFKVALALGVLVFLAGAVSSNGVPPRSQTPDDPAPSGLQNVAPVLVSAPSFTPPDVAPVTVDVFPSLAALPDVKPVIVDVKDAAPQGQPLPCVRVPTTPPSSANLPVVTVGSTGPLVDQVDVVKVQANVDDGKQLPVIKVKDDGSQVLPNQEVIKVAVPGDGSKASEPPTEKKAGQDEK